MASLEEDQAHPFTLAAEPSLRSDGADGVRTEGVAYPRPERSDVRSVSPLPTGQGILICAAEFPGCSDLCFGLRLELDVEGIRTAQIDFYERKGGVAKGGVPSDDPSSCVCPRGREQQRRAGHERADSTEPPQSAPPPSHPMVRVSLPHTFDLQDISGDRWPTGASSARP